MILVCVVVAGAANQSKLLGASRPAQGVRRRIVERYPLNQTTPCSISKTFISTTLNNATNLK